MALLWWPRAPRSAIALFASSALALPLLHCFGNGHAPNPLNGSDDAAVTPSFTYQPSSCAYSVTPPASRAFTAFAVDDSTAPSDPTQAVPQRVRTGLGGNTTKGQSGYADPTTSVAFTWETGIATTNAKVQLGTSPSALSQTFGGYSFTSPPPQAGFGANEPPEYVHEVHVCGLQAGTTYYYQVGGGAPGSEIWSATQSFTTVPASGSITVGVFGDARDTVSTWQLVNERMRDAAPNLLLVSGDIVDLGTDESLFTEWLNAIWQDPSDASATPFITLGQFIMVPIGGNHENDSSQFYANFAIPGTGDYAEQYASFDVGNTHFLLVDDQPIGEEEAAPSATEVAWVEADLTAADADRTNHPFVVAISHRSMFSTSEHATDPDVLTTRGTLAPLYDKHHVNLVFNGHDHEWEKTFPLNAGTPATGAPVVQSDPTKGTIYVINAGAGADPYQVGTYPSTYRDGNPVGLGSQGGNKYVGCYVLLTLSGTSLAVKSYGMKASGGSVAGDDVIDSFTLGQ